MSAPARPRAWAGLAAIAAALAVALVALSARGGDDAPAGFDATPIAIPDDAGELAPEAGPLRARRIATLTAPLHVAERPGHEGTLWAVEKAGRVVTIAPGGELATFLDLRDEVRHEGTEQGLLSIAFPPDHARTGLLYIAFTDLAGHLVVVELRARGGRKARPDAHWRPVLRIPQPNPIHQGGLLAFGPDGLLYLGAGDGGPSHDPRGEGQDRSTLRGTILRIDPRPHRGRPYRVPRANPFAGQRPGRAEIFAYGLRNPWRFAFDRRTGDLWIGDVGQDEWEEINRLTPRQARGANLGWAGYEGPAVYRPSERAPNAIPPTFAYQHGELGCSVIGGHVVRNRDYGPWSGRYLWSDFCTGEVRSLRVPRPGEPERDDRSTGITIAGIASFAEGLDGAIYATSIQGGVYRIQPPPPSDPEDSEG